MTRPLFNINSYILLYRPEKIQPSRSELHHFESSKLGNTGRSLYRKKYQIQFFGSSPWRAAVGARFILGFVHPSAFSAGPGLFFHSGAPGLMLIRRYCPIGLGS